MKKLKTRLNLGNVHYHSVQTLLSSHLQFVDINKRYTAVTLPPVVYGCETWSLMLWEEHWMTEFKNTVLRKVTGAKIEEEILCWRQLYEELHDFTPHQYY